MAEKPVNPAAAPVLQKPPGYREPAAQQSVVAPRPLPRKAPLPPSFRQVGKPLRRDNRRRYRHCCRRFCCWLIIVLLILAVVLAAAIGLAYVWFRPQLPSFKIQSIQITKLNITSKSSDSSTYLDSSISLRLLASNPNSKLSISYSQTDSTLTIPDDDGDIAAGIATVPGFVQGEKNSTAVKFDYGVKKGTLLDDAVGTRLKTRFKSGDLKFYVEIRTKVGVLVRNKRTGWRVPVKVECGAVTLKQVRQGGAVVPKCDINVLQWINLH